MLPDFAREMQLKFFLRITVLKGISETNLNKQLHFRNKPKKCNEGQPATNVYKPNAASNEQTWQRWSRGYVCDVPVFEDRRRLALSSVLWGLTDRQTETPPHRNRWAQPGERHLLNPVLNPRYQHLTLSYSTCSDIKQLLYNLEYNFETR